ncbi:prosaposin-like isoform X2 [Stegodyphus dumicola]|uniref:prosaposin-like isoform X2 n=1 Tax=Stegodyphus dumicola TaxID=202533 RepID=UPI0015A802C4|nr:prosaposin-like isoform X2 [Stegodyphus dumicola]
MRGVLFVLGALLCASAVSAFPKPRKEVPQQCADPTFACQDLENARLCDVVKSCVHDIWATMSAPDDNDEICDICKEMVKEARDQLLSNMTQEEIKEVFEGSCKLLPVKLVADACIKIVDEIIPELVEMLASRMDPNMVCTVSGLCNMAHLPVENHILKFLRMVLTPHKDSQCDQCTKMMTDVKTFLKSETEADVEKYIEKFCDKEAPSYLCDILVDNYFPKIYSYIVSIDAKTLCNSVGICAQKCELIEDKPSHLKDELTCEFCEHVLQHIKDLITANTTAEEFKTALLNFCKHTGKFSDKCTALVNDYYDMLFDYIKKLDTKGMCTLMQLCNNEKCSKVSLVKVVPAIKSRKQIPLIKLHPVESISKGIDVYPLVKLIPADVLSKKQLVESNEIFPHQLPLERLTHPLSIFEKDTECAFCKAISFYLEQDLNGDRSKVNVREALDAVCNKWVKDFPDHCQNFLKTYSLKVQYAIAKGTEFGDICQSVKACPIETHKELNVKVIPKPQDNAFCDLCKDAMIEVENQLNDPATKEKVENFLDQACNILPKSLRDDCNDFINQNVEALISILQQELKPDNICPALGLCPQLARIGVSEEVKDLECDVCKDVISSFKQKLQQPGSKTMVLTFLEEGCARLPSSLAEECKTFVDENIDTVMNIIIQELDPDLVCGMLKICPGSLKKEKPTKFKNLECDLCKEVIEKVEDLIKDKKTEEEIKNALDKVCSYLPSSIATKCENFVNQYTDLLITLLTQEVDPEIICAALNVCPAKDVECQGCQYVLHFVQEQLMNSETQEEIKNVLKKMCDALPEKLSANCEAFVEEYGDALLVLIAQEIDPSTLCYEVKLCDNQTKIFDKLPLAPLNSFKMDECSICTTVVDYLDKLLEEDDVDKEITKIVEKICTVVPASYKDKCSTLLETYGPYILQMIGQLADSRQVCQDIDFCPTPAGHVHLIGGNKCTFGPSYWCRSTAHAAACKAEKYCKTKAWKN